MTNDTATVLPPSAPARASAPIRQLRLGVGAKGGVCVYGLGRFPVTLYASQMEQLLGNKDAIIAFIASNASSLAYKQ